MGLCRELGDHEGCAHARASRYVHARRSAQYSAQCDCYSVQYASTWEDVALAAINAVPAGKAHRKNL